jgi:hypothetical protein
MRSSEFCKYLKIFGKYVWGTSINLQIGMQMREKKDVSKRSVL